MENIEALLKRAACPRSRAMSAGLILNANDLQIGAIQLGSLKVNGLSLLLVLFAFPLLSRGAEHKLRVLSTFLPIYCFTANVAGDLAEVENLVGNGISLHDYQLNPSDLLKIQRADIVFINGLGSDAFIEKAFQAEKKQKVIVVSKGFKSELIRDGGTVNPHIWLDPQLATRMVTNILIGLQGADPLHAAD